MRASSQAGARPDRDSAHEADKTWAHLTGGLLDLCVGERVSQPRRGVRNAREAEYANTEVPRRDHFEHRAHPDRMRAECTQHANLRRCLVGRSEKTGVHARLKPKA